MSKSGRLRIACGLLGGAALALSSFALGRAEPATPEDAPQDLTCQACHREFHTAWEQSSHGQASTEAVFREAWEAQGEPRECLACHTTGYDPTSDTYRAEGITCEACHSPVPANHPEDPMPADRSANLCGTCHTETLFEWQVSRHRQVNLACVACHDPHKTGLRAEDNSALCATCHRQRASNFAHSAHSQVGLTCADCHLGPLDGTAGEGHAVRDHSFNVRLGTCNACHAYQMHDPVRVHPDQPTPTAPDALASVETVAVTPEPEAVSPLGFAVLSGLIGMAGGMILAPWLERWYLRIRSDDSGE